jgi:uncharacterized protein YraI
MGETFGGGILRSTLKRLAVLSALVMVGLLVSAASALAIPAPIHISGTGGEGVFIRSGPSTSYTRVGWMPEGASPDYNCFVWGQSIGGVPIWFNVNYNGVTGFYASYYDDSSYHSNEELTAKYGVPLCGSPPPAAGPPPSPAPSPAAAPGTSPPPSIPNASFNRRVAVAWAFANAKNPQPYGTMCAWFVSQALWAAGLPSSSTWNAKGPYRYKNRAGLWATVPGTETAWKVGKLLDYLRTRFGAQRIDITRNLTTNAVPQAQIGDVIAYDWGKGDGISHVSLVVNIARGQYPEVAEMGQYDLGVIGGILNKINPVSSSYLKRGWTWSEVDKRWLQKGSPHMRAYLFHIPGGRA